MSRYGAIGAALFFAGGCGDDAPLVRIPSNSGLEAPPHATPSPPTDAPPPPPWSPIQGFEGTINYESMFYGDVPCSARIGLRGVRYEGYCPDCDFAFEIESDMLDASGTGCDTLSPYWSFVENDIYKNFKLGFADEYLLVENVLWFGYSLDLRGYGYDYYEGPYWAIIHHDGFVDQSFSFDGQQMSWSATSFVDYGYGLSDYLDYTCPPHFFIPAGPLPDALSADNEVGCDGYTMDVYEFDATRGDTVEVAIDTTSTWTTFQPFLLVNDTEGCVDAYSFGAFLCSYDPTPFALCPGIEIEIPETGTYRIIVQPIVGSCSDPERGEYTVQLQGASGGELRLLADDAPHYDEIRTFDIQVQLDGHLLLAD